VRQEAHTIEIKLPPLASGSWQFTENSLMAEAVYNTMRQFTKKMPYTKSINLPQQYKMRN
jgi:hypothetical protein